MKDLTPTQNRRLQVLVFSGGVLFLISSLIFGLQRSWRQAVASKLDAIRADGLPATLEDLDKWYVLTRGATNAADFYAQAFRSLKVDCGRHGGHRLPGIDWLRYPPVGEPLWPEVRSAVEAALAKDAEALRLLHAAAQMKDCRYQFDLSAGHAINYYGPKLIWDVGRAVRGGGIHGG